MPGYPRIPDDVSLVAIQHEGLFAIRGLEVFFLGTDTRDSLIPLLDGGHSYKEIRESLCSTHRQASTLSRMLRQMARDGLLVESNCPDPDPCFAPAAFRIADAIGQSPSQPFSGGVFWMPRRIGEEDNGCFLIPVSDPHGLVLLMAEDLLDARIAPWSRAADLRGQPWFLLQPEGTTALVGPLFMPKVGFNAECFLEQLGRFASSSWFLGQCQGEKCWHPVRRGLHADREAAILEVLEVCARSPSDHVLTHNMIYFPEGSATGQILPAMAALGELPGDRIMPPDTGDCVRTGWPDLRSLAGGRECSLEQIAKTLECLVHPVLGPVSRIETEPITGPDQVPSFRSLAFHPHRSGLRCWQEIEMDREHPSGGHGKTPLASRGAALAEALERIACLSPASHVDLRIARASDLEGDWISPADIEHFSIEQLAAINENITPFEGWDGLPRSWDPECLIPWVSAWDATASSPVWVPGSCGYRDLEFPGRPVAITSSNGVACGASLGEAMLHAFLELVERDAVAIWWYSRSLRPPLPESLFPSGTPLEAAQEGRTIRLIDLTHDFGIPVVAAVSVCSKESGVLLGFGCHFDAQIAAQKALGELRYQLRDESRSHGSSRKTPSRGIILPETEDPSWLIPDPKQVPMPLDPARPTPHTSRQATWNWCLDKTRSLGMRMLVLDQTPPGSPLPVARIIIPPLRHFWPRFAEGRLHDCPPSWGWQTQISTPITQTTPLRI